MRSGWGSSEWDMVQGEGALWVVPGLRCRRPKLQFSASETSAWDTAEVNFDGTRSDGGGEKGENGSSGGEVMLFCVDAKGVRKLCSKGFSTRGGGGGGSLEVSSMGTSREERRRKALPGKINVDAPAGEAMALSEPQRFCGSATIFCDATTYDKIFGFVFNSTTI
jgi:hypothetical protein